MNTAVRNYLRNREEFYSVLLPRVPHARIGRLITEVVGEIHPQASLLDSLEFLPDAPDTFLSALALRDLLKKPGFGAMWGRTTISVEEALARSEIVEETGLVLFGALAEMDTPSREIFEQHAAQYKATLSAVLQLTDDLRYHKAKC